MAGHHVAGAQRAVLRSPAAAVLLLFLFLLLQLVCPVDGECLNDCSGNGDCQSNSLCLCAPNFLASDCSVPAHMAHITVGRLDSYTFYWQLDPSSPALLHCRIIADTNADNFYANGAGPTADEHGWAALMFGAQDGMTGGRLVRVGWNATTDTPLVTSMYSAGFTHPTPVADSFVSSYTGRLTDKGLDVSFTIADVAAMLSPYTTSTVVPVSWAWGTVLSPMSIHGEGAHGRLRLIIDQQRVVKQQSLAFYNVVTVALVLAVALGLTMQLPFFKYSVIGQCCLHRRLPSIICCRGRGWRRAERVPSEDKDDHLITPSKSSSLTSAMYHTLSLLSFDLMDTVLGWSFGELVLVTLYVASLVAFVVQSYESFRSFASDPSLLLGHLTSVHLALSMLPVTRGSVFYLIFTMPYERAVAYHRYCSRLTYLFLCMHAYTMIKKYHLVTYRALLATNDLDHGDGVVWGTAAFVCITAMVLTSLAAVRRQKYELFYYVHLALFLPAVTFAAKHSDYFRYYLIVPLALLLVDYGRNLFRTYGGVKVQRARLVQGERDRVALLTLVLPNWQYEAGNYLMLYAPGVSLWQWHPYSVCGYRRRETGEAEVDVCLLDSGSGTWSAQLYELLAEKAVDVEVGEEKRRSRRSKSAQAEDQDEKREIAEFLDTTDDEDEDEDEDEGEGNGETYSPTTNLSIDSHTSSSSSSSGSYTITLYPTAAAPLLELSVYGPCGHLTFNPLHYTTLVFVAGGVGITPCVPLIQQLLSLSSSASSSPPPFIYLIWSSRNPHFLTSLFPSLLSSLQRSSRAQLLLFDSSQHVQPGRVAKRRRVALEAATASGGEASTVDVYEGRPNVRRLMDWVDRETMSGQQVDDVGGRRAREIEMVVQQQMADDADDTATVEPGATSPVGEDDLSLDSLEEDEHDGATAGGDGYRERVERAVERAVGARRGVGCVVCGPSGLISDVESGCNELGWDLSKETFLL